MILESFIPYLIIQTFGTIAGSVKGGEWIARKWNAANITNHDLQKALRASYADALNSINFAFRQKAGLLEKLGRKRLYQEITTSFNEQFLNPFVTVKKLSAEEVRSLAANCSAYCTLLRSSVDAIMPLTQISEVTIEDLLLTGRDLNGADDLSKLNSMAGEELLNRIRRIEGLPTLFSEFLAYKGLLLGSIVFFFNEHIKSDERVRSILMHSELQRIREENYRQYHQQVTLIEETLRSQMNSFNLSLTPIRDNLGEVVTSLERVEADLAQNTRYLERIYDMLCQDRGLSERERKQLQVGLSATFNLNDKYDFDKTSPIGYGSVAVVFKAVHKGLNQVRALKVLKPEYRDNPEIVERFLREAAILGSLNHPNIVRIFDTGGGGQSLDFYLDMEYINGATLRNFIQTQHFNWKIVLKLVRQLGSAIRNMHEAGIIHRDLNPRNIMVDQSGNLKVMDFGVAKIVGLEGLTRDGQIVGTHNYMAPEQAQGQRVDERADIYSFGAIVYELCTRHLPDVPPFPMRQYQVNVPMWLENIITKCLAQNRVDRYSSMKEALDLIENPQAARTEAHVEKGMGVSSPLDAAEPTTDEKEPGKVQYGGMIASPPWFWTGIVLLGIGILLQVVTTSILIRDAGKQPWGIFLFTILLFCLPFTIPGVIFLRKGIIVPFPNRPDKTHVSHWWWLLPSLLGLAGGIVSFLKHRNVDGHKAINMLTLGIFTTFLWSIPFLTL